MIRKSPCLQKYVTSALVSHSFYHRAMILILWAERCFTQYGNLALFHLHRVTPKFHQILERQIHPWLLRTIVWRQLLALELPRLLTYRSWEALCFPKSTRPNELMCSHRAAYFMDYSCIPISFVFDIKDQMFSSTVV